MATNYNDPKRTEIKKPFMKQMEQLEARSKTDNSYEERMATKKMSERIRKEMMSALHKAGFEDAGLSGEDLALPDTAANGTRVEYQGNAKAGQSKQYKVDIHLYNYNGGNVHVKKTMGRGAVAKLLKNDITQYENYQGAKREIKAIKVSDAGLTIDYDPLPGYTQKGMDLREKAFALADKGANIAKRQKGQYSEDNVRQVKAIMKQVKAELDPKQYSDFKGSMLRILSRGIDEYQVKGAYLNDSPTIDGGNDEFKAQQLARKITPQIESKLGRKLTATESKILINQIVNGVVDNAEDFMYYVKDAKPTIDSLEERVKGMKNRDEAGNIRFASERLAKEWINTHPEYTMGERVGNLWTVLKKPIKANDARAQVIASAYGEVLEHNDKEIWERKANVPGGKSFRGYYPRDLEVATRQFKAKMDKLRQAIAKPSSSKDSNPLDIRMQDLESRCSGGKKAMDAKAKGWEVSYEIYSGKTAKKGKLTLPKYDAPDESKAMMKASYRLQSMKKANQFDWHRGIGTNSERGTGTEKLVWKVTGIKPIDLDYEE